MYVNSQEVKPSALLQPYVDCYWMVSFSGAAGETSPAQSCLPFGMVEIIVQLDDNGCDVCVNGEWHPLPKIFLAGMYQQTVLWRACGNTRKFGIRLKPETFGILFKMPSAMVLNDFTIFQNIVGRDADVLLEQLAAADGMQAMVALAESFLLTLLRRHRQEHNYVIEAARLIRSTKGNISIDAISKTVYVSPRQLQRSFRSTMGTNPKTYMRIIRFRNAYVQMQYLKQHGGWSGLSYELGYADQAHFIKEFKEFTGIVPSLVHQNESLAGASRYSLS